MDKVEDHIKMLAADVASKAEAATPGLPPIPIDVIWKMLQSLFSMIFAGFCQPTPQEATNYINNQRPFRIRRITRETLRQLQAVAPDMSGEQVNAVVQEVLFRCKVATVGQMTNFYTSHQSSRSS